MNGNASATSFEKSDSAYDAAARSARHSPQATGRAEAYMCRTRAMNMNNAASTSVRPDIHETDSTCIGWRAKSRAARNGTDVP